MQNKTRRLFAAYKAEIAKLNGVDRVDEKFTVSPTVQQRLENKVQESSAFLSKINVYPVTEQEGEKLGLGVSGPIASTTDTSQQDRQTADISTLDGRRYRCEQTNSDTHITYQKLDAWAKFPDFQTRIRDAILKRQALDRMTIGFNGVKRTPTSTVSPTRCCKMSIRDGCSTCATALPRALCGTARHAIKSSWASS